MKHLFLALNSKYIHTLLAPRYLVANCNYPVEILESNVNVDFFELLDKIKSKNPDTISISCYIFNIAFVRKLLPYLSEYTVILGGYEVSFDIDRYLDKCSYIIKGEGDFSYGNLIEKLENGIFSTQIIESGVVTHLDNIKSPYTLDYAKEGKTKILYMETTRGCPFSCSYCMSANTHGVRSFSTERVFSDLENLMAHSPKQIKFVDRTFNFDINRTKAIIKFIKDNYSENSTNFHFEMAPELFDEELLSLLADIKSGFFQFEIGVQSYNKETLKAVNRYANIEKINKNLIALGKTNVHIHVDLIAGLPFENYASFVSGFNMLIATLPECLQLGFLKVLKGSKIYEQREDFHINDFPPYEILSSKWITNEELLLLHNAEKMLERYYNSGRYKLTMKWLFDKNLLNYDFFSSLYAYQINNYIDPQKLSAFYQCDVLYDFLKIYDDKNLLEVLINTDFHNSGNTRKWRRHIGFLQP